jgi:predicted unusual protein kinase regulating ubiquinone biosynthesis (AarF/ABC1/UbiB family)
MKRRYERLLGQAAAQGRRLLVRAQQLIATGDAIDDDAERRAAELAEAEAIAESASELRGGVTKVAQLRAYIQGHSSLAPEAQAVLSRLWDHLPGEAPQAVRRVIAEELGAAPEALFQSFSDEPLAAASLGQVHAARTHDGEDVVVKIQYPGVAAALMDDLRTRDVLQSLVGADLGDALSEEALEGLKARLLAELDYKAEAESLLRFGRAFARDPSVVIPRVVPKLSTGRVLTMQRLHGRSLPEHAQTGAQEERSATALTLFRFAFLSPWRHRVVNLDPNPGNYLVLDPSEGQARGARVGFVDFGCTAALPDELVDADRRMFLAMIHRDGEELRYAAHEAGLIERASAFQSTNYRGFEAALSAPFLSREETALDPEWARELTDLTWRLVKTGRMVLPPAGLLLWRQRLGVLAVLASLRPRLPLRRILCDLLDDGENPLPLYDRYR